MALLALTLALLAMTVATMAIMMKPLDMAPNSFDDQYQGCGPDMEDALPALHRSEFQKNPLFAKAWSEAVAEWQKVESPVSPLSSSAQAITIKAYHAPDLYEYFNWNVSIFGRSPQEYWDKFHFKTLHFLLSKAVATLTATQKQKCQGVIHLANYKFYASPGDIVRLGQFALSWGFIDDSLSALTVFKVQTCHGADISTFAGAPDNVVVLIPPYEKFKVTNVNNNVGKVEIHLDSLGTYSKYNCEWLKGGSVPTTPASSEDDHQDHQDSQRNEATKATKATMTTMAVLAIMTSMWSLRPPLALWPLQPPQPLWPPWSL
ncbi:erythroblast NAD(P)(+)--arginine ADP-ribosyltransferase-like protein [Turdus rufiventris]|nr:erythroblast NAD(P)(+)--arginine ADP-ribosyltransferase-like protein [Turdus rufiventris]